MLPITRTTCRPKKLKPENSSWIEYAKQFSIFGWFWLRQVTAERFNCFECQLPPRRHTRKTKMSCKLASSKQVKSLVNSACSPNALVQGRILERSAEGRSGKICPRSAATVPATNCYTTLPHHTFDCCSLSEQLILDWMHERSWCITEKYMPLPDLKIAQLIVLKHLQQYWLVLKNFIQKPIDIRFLIIEKFRTMKNVITPARVRKFLVQNVKNEFLTTRLCNINQF